MSFEEMESVIENTVQRCVGRRYTLAQTINACKRSLKHIDIDVDGEIYRLIEHWYNRLRYTA